MSKIPYKKPAKTYVDQLNQLKRRGLKINDDQKALHLLEKISYYRLSGYWYPLLSDPKKDHVFKANANFQTAFLLYRFDREFRTFLLKELEKIEVAIRAQMIYVLSHYKGPFWMNDPTIFNDGAKHSKSIQKITNEAQKSDEEFIKSFYNTYTESLPPSWMTLEITSFGSLSMFYQNLKSGKSKREIANKFGLDDGTFGSWVHSFVYIRNVCAHHSRLWNRGMSIRPQIPMRTTNQWLNNSSVNNNRTYFVMSMVLYLLQSIDAKNKFLFRFNILLKRYKNVDVTAMGFPPDWRNEPLWQCKLTLGQRFRYFYHSLLHCK